MGSHLQRRSFAAALGLVLAGHVRAQTFRDKTIRIVATGPVGSALDLVLRPLAEGIAAVLHQPVVVDNRPAANGALAGEMIAHLPSDGYSLLFATTSVMAIAPHLNKGIKWNALKDFTPVIEVGTTPSVFAVATGSPYGTFGSLITAAKQKPDTVTFGVFNLTLSHFVALALKQNAGIDLRIIPFSTQPQMIAALLNNDIDMISTGAGSLVPFFEAGKMKALAVTSSKQLGIMPGTPPMSDTVPGLDLSSWYGLFGPAGMDAKLVRQINLAANQVIADPAFQEKMRLMATTTVGGEPSVLRQALELDYHRYGEIVRKSSLSLSQ